MIIITKYDTGIDVTGHSGYAPRGQDIVCAAISTLTETLVASLREISKDKIHCDIRQGEAVIRHEGLTEQGKLLVESFFIGASGVANAYPDHIKISREARPSVEVDKSNGR